MMKIIFIKIIGIYYWTNFGNGFIKWKNIENLNEKPRIFEDKIIEKYDIREKDLFLLKKIKNKSQRKEKELIDINLKNH